ncbi:MAG: peptide-methionine (S)-S-oxide reductase MsrA [Xanthomonadaceae bacterium]|nr:peptide-methionine (S)-S-oxide reductase MsrA [Xanthomonadaceae bacterium]
MIRRSAITPLLLAVTVLLGGLAACRPVAATGEAVRLPAPALDATAATSPREETAVLAGGCFWGVAAVFEHVKGVQQVTAGYSGGAADTAHYDMVSDGDTGHAESVRVRFDPSKISYGQLLQVFFSVALNPTELDRQGPDSGSQYRSVIFYNSGQQQKIADAYIAQLGSAKVFSAPIVTQVVPLKAFYPAEDYHQHYFRLHPDNPYIVINDAPKVAHLRELFPARYRDDRNFVDVRLH